MKKILLISTLILPSVITFGQDTTFYDGGMHKVMSRDSAKCYKVNRYFQDKAEKNIERIYYMSGQIKIEKHLSDYDPHPLEGKYKEYYENGKIKKDIDYFNGKLDGEVLIYCPDGKPKRKDEYQDGKLIKGKCFTCEGKDTAYIIYEGPCDFPGGENKMMAYLMKELVYPQVDKEKGNSGTVYLTFMVEKDGSITDIKILRGVSETIDAEAIRVVKKMPKFIPAMHDGEPIRMQWSMPLKFILQ